MGYITIGQVLRRFLRPRRLAIFEAALIGLVSAFAIVLLKQGVALLGSWRVAISYQFPAWWVLPAIGFLCGLLSGLLMEWFAPEAAGSGIPQVKAVLATVPIPLDLRVALVKLVGAVLALGSGLPLGREGPTIQVGAALAAQLSRWFPTSPSHRRQLIAAGAGAGLAASFGTPIAGVLFVVEGLFHDVSGFTLGTEILASFIGSVVSRLLGGEELDLSSYAISAQTHFTAGEIPFYLLLGILAGLLAPLFINGVVASLTLSRRVLRLSLPLRVGLAGLIAGITMACLPETFRDNAGVREMLATGSLSWQLTAIALASQFFLTLVAYGAGAPGGLFAPILLIGSALGYLVGTGEMHSLAVTLPVTYAFVGMGAFFSAVNRVPITAVVIVFELTTDFNLVLPLMISSVMAYFVADRISSQSLFDRLLAWNGIRLGREAEGMGAWAELTATEVMQRRVETLASQITLEQAIQAFSRSHHRGFPVVEDGKLVGIVTQSDLDNIPQTQTARTMTLSEIMTRHPVTVRPTDKLMDVLSLLTRTKLSRLPVTEGRQLLGIITRSDILRAESAHLSGNTGPSGPQAAPSYCVYQTRAPATGDGRILVPLGNPLKAAPLLQIALAIARDRNYELECLHAIQIPSHTPPREATVDAVPGRRLLQQAVRLGRAHKIPVHTQIRVAHDVAQTILETIKERHIKLLIMGWKGSTLTPGRIFSDVVDTAIRQADCTVVLVKLDEALAPVKSGIFVREARDIPAERLRKRTSANLHLNLNRWLIFMAGGPNAQQAVQLLPGLVSLGNSPEIRLCQVSQPAASPPDETVLEDASHFLKQRLSYPVISTPVCAESVPDAAIDLVQKKQCDAIVLGASREGMLTQAIRGNIPETIARNCNCTVILVRSAVNQDSKLG